MTVCISTLFLWNHGTRAKTDYAYGAITASDRMLTVWDSKFEPPKQKICFLSKELMLLVAGDVALHSEAIGSLEKDLPTTPDKGPENVALLYGRKIQGIKLRRAEDQFMAPLGLNSDTFLAQQKDMADIFIDRLTTQMQNSSEEDVEALVVGSNGKHANIYAIDHRGTVTCCNDVGFAAIGIGAWHARSSLIQAGYHNNLTLAPALAATFAAKKLAQIAPGVGDSTDLYLVTRDGHMRLSDGLYGKLHEVHNGYSSAVTDAAISAIDQLQGYIDSLQGTQNEPAQQPPERGQTPNERASATTSEAARENKAE